ncbi:hypothetical protein BGV68_33765 [Burkholderia ubonensis]|nr:hypothetical protein WK76_15660 [Burkholderia ubonensis]OJA43473.1 hypothetical protein BGV68_33765 [Burkholderia ubonensis]
MFTTAPWALRRCRALAQRRVDPFEQECGHHDILDSFDGSRRQLTLRQFHFTPQFAIMSLYFERYVGDARHTHHIWHRRLWMDLAARSHCRINRIMHDFALDALSMVLQYIQEPTTPALRATDTSSTLRIESA